jgi:hypothetical protein
MVVLFVVLLISQAGVAAVCSSGCEPAAMGVPLAPDSSPLLQAHSHHHPVAEAPALAGDRALKSQSCGRTVFSSELLRAVAPAGNSLLTPSSEFVFVVGRDSISASRLGVTAVPSISPPHYSVLRI